MICQFHMLIHTIKYLNIYRHMCVYRETQFVKHNTALIAKIIYMGATRSFKFRRIMSLGSLFQYGGCSHWAHNSLGSSLIDFFLL